MPKNAGWDSEQGVTCSELDALLKRIEETDVTDINFPQMVRSLARNFENFPEKPLDGEGGREGLAVGRNYGQRLFAKGRKGMSEFVGYTFKRDVGVMESLHSNGSAVKPREESQKISGFVPDPVDDHELI